VGGPDRGGLTLRVRHGRGCTARASRAGRRGPRIWARASAARAEHAVNGREHCFRPATLDGDRPRSGSQTLVLPGRAHASPRRSLRHVRRHRRPRDGRRHRAEMRHGPAASPAPSPAPNTNTPSSWPSDRHRDPRHPASTNAASAIIRASQAMEPAPRRRSQPSTQKSGTLSARLEVSVDRAGSPGAVEPPPGRCAVYGVGSANVPPKMSELPNVAGQSCSGAGAAGLWPSCSAWRQVSIAGQSAPLLVSFHTAAP
jgi:hypothetical protein